MDKLKDGGGGGVWRASEADLDLHIKKKELQLHCKRRTRGVEQTRSLIDNLLSSFSSESGKDTMGIPVLDADLADQIWDEQKRHLACIQDLEGKNLYTQIRTIKKGGIELPVYRCARGSVSLESFHNHIVRFIPGTVANDSHFQAYLLEGILQWNKDREQAAQGRESGHFYNSAVQLELNRASAQVYGEPIDPSFHPPLRYTGEMIGVEYLYSQTGRRHQGGRRRGR
ncbi:uncharacterized protein LOC106150837 [Lingula anatina]|uniref:Uncharacterized protein LOC106150837 n=1 Tax=Lingula anatina TaxID=7574 RepID=A0A1S3GZJ1_LINAN|nr:uncharacterized protein LOC106150837 [Lingula anatina]|eukprot:XP_013379295.1 uncharacterized protein LOC106150837 [Lingula anatina]